MRHQDFQQGAPTTSSLYQIPRFSSLTPLFSPIFPELFPNFYINLCMHPGTMRQTTPATLLQRSGALHTKRHNCRKTPLASLPSPPPLRPIFLPKSPVLCETLFLKIIHLRQTTSTRSPQSHLSPAHPPSKLSLLTYHLEHMTSVAKQYCQVPNHYKSLEQITDGVEILCLDPPKLFIIP